MVNKLEETKSTLKWSKEISWDVLATGEMTNKKQFKLVPWVEAIREEWEKKVRKNQRKKDAQIADDFALKYYLDMEGKYGEELEKLAEGNRAAFEIRNAIEMPDLNDSKEKEKS